MTKEEIISMGPGRELDVLIAKHVFEYDVHSLLGFKYDLNADYECNYVIDEPPDDCPKEWKPFTGQIITERVKDYSTDISMAWEVVKKMAEKDWMFELQVHKTYGCNKSYVYYSANFYRCSQNKIVKYHYCCDSVSEAICKAALIAVIRKGGIKQ